MSAPEHAPVTGPIRRIRSFAAGFNNVGTEFGPLAGVVKAFAGARVLLALGALAAGGLVPGGVRNTALFVALVSGLAVPYAIVVLIATMRRASRGASMLTLLGDSGIVFLMQAGFPSLRASGHVSYMLLVAFYTPVAGLTVGLATAALGVGLTALAMVIKPVPGGFPLVPFFLFAGSAAALAVVVAAAALHEREGMRRRVSTVSHELRGPLTSIEGFAATLAERWSEIEDPQRFEYLGRIRRNAASVHEIVKTFLEAADAEAGARKPVPSDISLSGFVHNLCDVCAPMLQDRPVRIEIPTGMLVAADPTLLERVLVNLVMNAHGYSPPGEPIDVTAIANGSNAVVSVRDHGPGISEETRARIFEPFWRPSGQSRRGSGIGLGLVREFAEAMGGRVWVDSHPGAGSVFSFSLPLVRSERRVG